MAAAIAVASFEKTGIVKHFVASTFEALILVLFIEILLSVDPEVFNKPSPIISCSPIEASPFIVISFVIMIIPV